MTDRSQDDRADESRFVQSLRRALRRHNPNDDFASRLMTRIAQRTQTKPTVRSWWPLPRLGWVTAGVMCMSIVIGAAKYEQQRQRAKGEAARQQVFVALRIAGAKIQLAQSRVQQLSQR